eukprot:50628_1
MGTTHDTDHDALPDVDVISIQDLKLCDHIYRQCGSQHHAIVTHIPPPSTKLRAVNIKVHTLTILDDYAEIQEIPLTHFLKGNKLLRVKYGVDVSYESVHVEGSCHQQIKSKPRAIMDRCNAIKRKLDEMNDDITSFFLNINESLDLTRELNENHLAFWCSSGIVHHTIQHTTAGALLNAIQDQLGVVCIEESEDISPDLSIDTEAQSNALAAPAELASSHSMPNQYAPSDSKRISEDVGPDGPSLSTGALLLNDIEDKPLETPMLTTSHVISIRDLKLCDHIYHVGSFASWWQRHGIVTHIPEARTRRSADTIKVHTLATLDDYAEIQEISLKQFLNGYKLRRVKYDVTAWYESLHVEGSSHRQIKSKPRAIMERCNAIKRELNEMNDDRTRFFLNESLNLTSGLNDSHFAFWCSSGIPHKTIANTKAGAFLDDIEDNRLGIVREEDDTEESKEYNACDASDDLLPSYPMPNSNLTYRPSLCTEPIDRDDSPQLFDIHNLKLGDHIYHFIKTSWYPDVKILSKHHGIITFIPPDETKRNEGNIKVLEMIKRGIANRIREVSLTEFRQNRKIHKVKYGVSKAVHDSFIGKAIYGVSSECRLLVDPDSHHLEHADDPQTIIERCNEIRYYESSQLHGMTSEQFALYCTLGTMSSVNKLKLAAQDSVKSGAKTVLKKGITVTKNLLAVAKASPSTAARVAAEVVETSVEVGGGTVAIETTKEASKQLFPVFAVGCLVGVSVGVEAVFTICSIYHYRNNPKALWYDTKCRIAKGWCSTACTVAAGIICLAVGVTAWPALAITVGAGVVSYLVWLLINTDKSEKEKIFKERGLELGSSIREKEAEKRLINKEIVDQRLHPDMYKRDLPQQYVKVYEFTQRPFDITITSDEEDLEETAMVASVGMRSWVKGIRYGMIVYSINHANVKNETFENIEAQFDGYPCDDTSPLRIGLYCFAKVEKETKRRRAKYFWLQSVKTLIEDDIEECKRRRRGIRRTTTRPRSAPLAITL